MSSSRTPTALERKRRERAEQDRKRQAEIDRCRHERQAAEDAAERARITELLRPAREAAANRVGK